MRRISLIALVLSLAGGLAGFGASRPEGRGPSPVVAVAGDVEVTAEAFRQAYVAYLLRTGLADRPGLRRTFLDDLLAGRLLVAETRAAGIEREAAYRFRQEQVRQKLLLEAYVRQALFDTLRVTEPELREAFVRVHTRIKARHLYARTPEQAALLYARLQAGARFEDLAREVFADSALARSGGSLGYFGFDETDPAFEEAAFALKVGDLSAPVRTAQGYSIIQVEDRFTDPLLTETDYAGRRPRLVPYVRYRKQQRARQEHLHALQDALAVTFHDAAFDRLLGQVTGQALDPGAEAADAWLAEPLVSFGPPGRRQTWTVAGFRDRARFTDERQRARVRTRDDLADFVAGLVVREAMTERAREKGLDRTAAYEQAFREAMDDWVLQTARDRLAASVEVPEDSVRAYVEAAGSRAFLVPDRVHVRELVLATKAEAEQVKAGLPYASFEALARAFSIRSASRTAGGDLGFLSRDQLGVLAGPVFDAPAGTVLGPLDVQGEYVLLQVGEREAARQMTPEEARDTVREQLRAPFTRTRLRDAYAAVRARHPVKVDGDLLFSMTLTDEKTD